MKHVIVASHGKFAEGAVDTLKMCLGDVSNLHVITFDLIDAKEIVKPVLELLGSFDKDDLVYVLTDMLGSQVNTAMVGLKNDFPNMHVIAGMNFPLLFTIAMPTFAATGELLEKTVADARDGMIIC